MESTLDKLRISIEKYVEDNGKTPSGITVHPDDLQKIVSDRINTMQKDEGVILRGLTFFSPKFPFKGGEIPYFENSDIKKGTFTLQ
jgi:hypothetical protein